MHEICKKMYLGMKFLFCFLEGMILVEKNE